MLAFVVANLDPRADMGRAVNALRAPALHVLSLDVAPGEFVAAIGYEDVRALWRASERMRSCPGVTSTYLSLPETIA